MLVLCALPGVLHSLWGASKRSHDGQHADRWLHDELTWTGWARFVRCREGEVLQLEISMKGVMEKQEIFSPAKVDAGEN